MKRFFILIFTITTLFSTKLIGAEIIPEYFLMERLIMLMDVAPTYISIDGKQELKAMQIDKKTMDILGNNENPFYIYDSNGEKKLVRVGDYFFSPTTLSSIYVLDKENFEFNFRNKALPEEKIETTIEHTSDKINTADIDEATVSSVTEN
ncbi:hypothetical protein [Fusobacterium mortiferum]|uniref:Uncharacterized protein n=1 Tax=Fusobacterium mortiferum TaxID=850 RepID=A0ABS2G2Z0_FUSMR|nr:hypothetical protein [Fusobacterium mortiferum]MBM6875110.1 hypothetical protein [Fusobacterium mortiferum]